MHDVEPGTVSPVQPVTADVELPTDKTSHDLNAIQPFEAPAVQLNDNADANGAVAAATTDVGCAAFTAVATGAVAPLEVAGLFIEAS